MPVYETWSSERTAEIIAQLVDQPGALLPILHELQATFGCIPEPAVPMLADALNLSRAEVHGVITYYHHFRQHPGGRHTIRLCRAEACQAVGADALAEHAKQALGCNFHGATADGAFSLEPAFCLGQCAAGPAMLIDDDIHARVTAGRFDALTHQVRGGR